MSQLLTERAVRRLLELANVFWLYEGPPRKEAPHALLTSGLHSDGYVDVGRALKDHPETRVALAEMMLGAFFSCTLLHGFNWVVGADTSSTALAEEIARLAQVGHIKMVKTEDERGKRQVWDPENLPLQNGQRVLHIEELITTASSALQVREGIRLANPGVEFVFAPFLPVVVERSNPDNRVTEVDGSEILSLLQLNIRNYQPGPETCPYCAVGSEALKPKHGDNWKRLTGK